MSKIRFEKVTEPVKDVNGTQLYYKDKCEFTTLNTGEIFIGTIDDLGHDYCVEYGFSIPDAKDDHLLHCYHFSYVTNIKLIDSSNRDPLNPACKIPNTTDFLKQELLNCGFTTQPHPDGFLVNGKFVVSAYKRKWRNASKIKWYPYRQVENLKKYFL